MNQRVRHKILTAVRMNLPSFLTVCFFLLLPQVDFAQKINFQKHYFDVQKVDLTIAEIVATPKDRWRDTRAFNKEDGGKDGYTGWIRVDLPATRENAQPELAALVSFPLHMILDYFLVEDGQVIHQGNFEKRFAAGEMTPGWLVEPYVFRQSENVDRTLYVKALTIGRLLGEVDIYEYKSLKRGQVIQNWVVGFMLGGGIGIVIYNLFLAYRMRKLMYVYYAAFLAAMLSISAVFAGVIGLIHPSLHYGSLSIAIFCVEAVLIALMALLLFQRSFFSFDQSNMWLFAYNAWIVGTLLVFAVIIPWIPLRVYPAVLSLTMIVIVVRSRIIIYKSYNIATIREYGIAMSALIGGWIVSMLTWFEFIDADLLRIHAFQVGGIFASAYLSTSISDRIRELEQKRLDLIDQMKRGSKPEDGFSGGAVGEYSALESAEICVMFIDIASFSQLAASLPSSRVFAELSQRITEMANIVREFGGHIDRSLGDGLLCFFGYKSNEDAKLNTLNAFQAALKIQLLTAFKASEAELSGKKTLLMPVRIGIHSAKVVLGNLGGSTRIDYTMIGSGLNFAARLEAACAPFRIIVSELCKNYLVQSGQDPEGFANVAVSVKHVEHFVTAFEFDPFKNLRDLLGRAEQIHLHQLGVKTIDHRFTIGKNHKVLLRGPDAAFFVQDFSKFGFRVICDQFFGRLATLSVKVETPSDLVNKTLHDHYADELTVEVRWSRATAEGYEHGLRIVGGCLDLKNFVFEQLSKHFSGSGRLDATDAQEVAS